MQGPWTAGSVQVLKRACWDRILGIKMEIRQDGIWISRNLTSDRIRINFETCLLTWKYVLTWEHRY